MFSFNDPNVTPDGPAGQKRKASTEIENIKFDENGNWTLETAKTRLSKFYQSHSYDFNEPLQCAEVGHPPNKQYQVRTKYNAETHSNSCSKDRSNNIIYFSVNSNLNTKVKDLVLA